MRVTGWFMHDLITKLKLLKKTLKVWNKEVSGIVHSYDNYAKNNLSEIQNQIKLGGHTYYLMIDEKKAHMILDEALHRQEVSRKEKVTIS